MRSRHEREHWLSIRFWSLIHPHDRIANNRPLSAEQLATLTQRNILSVIHERHGKKSFGWKRDAAQVTWRLRQLAALWAARNELRYDLISKRGEDSQVLRE
jgi:hypothetical protein